MAKYVLQPSELGRYGSWANPDPNPKENVEREVEEFKRELDESEKENRRGGNEETQGKEDQDEGKSQEEGEDNRLNHLNLSKFFKLAKAQCANYSAVGPRKKKHYCYLEPRQSDHRCLLHEGARCKWFVEAVLPLDEDLEKEWEEVWMRDSLRARMKARAEVLVIGDVQKKSEEKSGEKFQEKSEGKSQEKSEGKSQDKPKGRIKPLFITGKTNFKLCKCGKRFKPTNNRQKYCPKCSKEESKKQSRARSKKHRTVKEHRAGKRAQGYEEKTALKRR